MEDGGAEMSQLTLEPPVLHQCGCEVEKLQARRLKLWLQVDFVVLARVDDVQSLLLIRLE